MVLMLIRDGLLALPILYLSQHLKAERESYYHLLNRTRESRRLGKLAWPFSWKG